MNWVKDMMGRRVDIPGHPRRIVSLVPSQTELLCDLGLDEEVVGITKFCVHPESWFRNKTRVGGTKAVHVDRVAGLYPDLILANKEENVQEQIDELATIAPVWVSDIHTLEDVLRMIEQIGQICRKEDAAHDIARRIVEGFRLLPVKSVKTKVAYCIWRKPWMWAGGDTFIHNIMGQSGMQNVLEDVLRYPELPLEELAVLRPEVVLLSSEPYPFKAEHIAEIKAVMPDVAVKLVDGEMFSWYGSRLLHTPAYLADLHHSL